MRRSPYRIEFRRRHLVFAVVLLGIAFASLRLGYVQQLKAAEARIGELRSLTALQRSRLQHFDARASEITTELRRLQLQDEEIKRLFQGRGQSHFVQPPAARGAVGMSGGDEDFDVVDARIARLETVSARERSENTRLRRLALRVLNVHHIEDLARARVLAEIPSLNPAGENVGIRSPYGWRVDPWPEFHAGVDLDVDYGDPVRAAAAGMVAAAGYDGGYGIKIDIDHGNGYRTWYCHLSRADVRAGQYVAKGQLIALVGSTGESTGPHLHYQIMLAGHAVDPEPYLSGIPGRVLANLK